MTAVLQGDLFGATRCSGALQPQGFDYWPDALSPDAQARLVEDLQTLVFKPYEHLGYLAHRRIAAFGHRYDRDGERLVPAEPWPDFLVALLRALAERIGVERQAYVQVLINEYVPGAGIGWHRDRPVYGEIMGLSLLAPCVMRLRRRDGAGWMRSSAPLASGGVYRLADEVRHAWEHSITPMTALRYSITFRTLQGSVAKLTR